uniref:Uncharacterized protein n=1 Tax=Otus sunia TaxID=257818 RepID=A0A8C8B006_9STRI
MSPSAPVSSPSLSWVLGAHPGAFGVQLQRAGELRGCAEGVGMGASLDPPPSPRVFQRVLSRGLQGHRRGHLGQPQPGLPGCKCRAWLPLWGTPLCGSVPLCMGQHPWVHPPGTVPGTHGCCLSPPQQTAEVGYGHGVPHGRCGGAVVLPSALSCSPQTSVLCKAAVHAGVIADELGGQVTLSRQKGITLYESAFANGLHSKRGSLSEKRLIFHKACGDALEVATFNASSWWHEVDALGQDRAWVAQRAAFGTAGHSWAAEPGSEAAWLELDLGTRRNVTGIITKGSSEQYDYYVTSYRVSSSRDGKNWRPYRGSGGQEDKVFEGNTDSHGEVSNAFIPPIVARYVRVTPQRWHQRVALKVALVGCQLARVRAPRPYVPSVPREVSVPTSRPAGHTPIPGVAMDPEKAGSTLLVVLLISGFVLLSSSLLLLAFLCHRKRKSAAELNGGIAKGYPKAELSPGCSLQSLPPPSSALASFPTAQGDLSQTHSPEYAEPDLLQVSPSSPTGPSTFKPLLDEGYTLPLVVSHYDVPGKYHEYAEPLPPEPEYATPFSEPDGTRRSPGGITGLPASLPAPYDAPGELLTGDPPPWGRPERTVPSAEGPLGHVYHEAL